MLKFRFDRRITVRFVLRELSIFLQCFDYAIELLRNSSVLLWPGTAYESFGR